MAGLPINTHVANYSLTNCCGDTPEVGRPKANAAEAAIREALQHGRR